MIKGSTQQKDVTFVNIYFYLTILHFNVYMCYNLYKILVQYVHDL